MSPNEDRRRARSADSGGGRGRSGGSGGGSTCGFGLGLGCGTSVCGFLSRSGVGSNATQPAPSRFASTHTCACVPVTSQTSLGIAASSG